jgi:hypothetical protein
MVRFVIRHSRQPSFVVCMEIAPAVNALKRNAPAASVRTNVPALAPAVISTRALASGPLVGGPSVTTPIEMPQLEAQQ